MRNTEDMIRLCHPGLSIFGSVSHGSITERGVI